MFEKKQSATEKLFREVATDAARKLGLKKPIRLIAQYGPFADAPACAVGLQAMNARGTKHIVRVRLDGPNPVNTLLHELRHCWQSEALGNRTQKTLYQVANGTVGYDHNPFEVDANAWADENEGVYV